MKKGQKIKRILLSVNDQDLPVILGIVCTDPDYKLSLKLNRKLGISLKNTPPVTIQDDKSATIYFSCFADNTTYSGSTIQLVSNRSEKTCLLRKLWNIDFLMLIHDHDENVDVNITVSKIREVESITGVFVLEFKKLKDKNLRLLV
jgi:hypothetical protein